jgi:hypothetical protein
MHDAGDADSIDGRSAFDPPLRSCVPVFDVRFASTGHCFDGLIRCLVHDIPKLAVFLGQRELKCYITRRILSLVKLDEVFRIIFGEFA